MYIWLLPIVLAFLSAKEKGIVTFFLFVIIYSALIYLVRDLLREKTVPGVRTRQIDMPEVD